VAALTGGKRALAVAVPLVGAIWAYDTRLKNTAAGPAGMALCRGLDVLLGATPGRLRPALRPAMVVAAHTYAVTALSRREVHGADRLLPAVTMAATAMIAAAPAALQRTTRAPHSPNPSRSRQEVAGGRGAQGVGGGRWWRAGLTEALSGFYAQRFLSAQRKVLADPCAGNVRASVGAGITSLPALQGALASAHGAPVAGLLVAAAAPMGRRLARAVSPT
jgi:4-hydroxybenzoate polyprenyltransferase